MGTRGRECYSDPVPGPLDKKAFGVAMRKQAHETTARSMLCVGGIYLGLSLVNFLIPTPELAYSFVLPSCLMGGLYLGLWRWVRRYPEQVEVEALFLAGFAGLIFASGVILVAPDATSFYVLLSTMVGIGCISFDMRSSGILTVIAFVVGWFLVKFHLPSEMTGPLIPQLLGTGAFAMVLTWIRRATLADAIQSIHELELRVQQERVILDGALDAVVIADSLGNIIEWNGQAEEIFEWTRQEAIGKRLADTIIPERYRDAHAEGMRRMRSGGEPRVVGSRIEIEAIAKSGREFPIELAITRSSLPTEVQFTAFLRDITDRRSAERAQVLARETAEEADRLKSEFLATISHEIRTPLNGIFGMTEMALDATEDAERRDFLERSQSCAQTLIALVGDVLDFSRFESGQIELEHISFDLRKLSEGVTDIFAVEAAAKNVELILAIDSAVPQFVRGDPTRVRQVLLNLIGNAVKFTHAGHVALEIAMVDVAEGDPLRLQIAVEDTGIGLAQEDLGMIFDVFRQADVSTTRQFGGVGLGLAISQRLVALMGSEIQVRSVLGEGSRFSFEIPFEGDEAKVAAELQDCPADRVLLWEESGRLALHLRALLEAWGSAVTLVQSFSEANDALREKTITFDLMMIRADANEDLEEISQVLSLARAVGTPVLATCPVGELQSVRKRFPAMTRVLTRPGNEADLRRAAAQAVADLAGS